MCRCCSSSSRGSVAWVVMAWDSTPFARGTIGHGLRRRRPAMLTAEENAQLTRVGPGTVMGELMRQYWIPVVQSSELAAGGRPKRVRILGEELITYRNPGGRAAVC